MNDFQITSACKGCETLAAEVNALRLRLAAIDAKADTAKKEIFGSFSGTAYELWKEIKNPCN